MIKFVHTNWWGYPGVDLQIQPKKKGKDWWLIRFKKFIYYILHQYLTFFYNRLTCNYETFTRVLKLEYEHWLFNVIKSIYMPLLGQHLHNTYISIKMTLVDAPNRNVRHVTQIPIWLNLNRNPWLSLPLQNTVLTLYAYPYHESGTVSKPSFMPYSFVLHRLTYMHYTSLICPEYISMYHIRVGYKYIPHIKISMIQIHGEKNINIASQRFSQSSVHYHSLRTIWNVKT